MTGHSRNSIQLVPCLTGDRLSGQVCCSCLLTSGSISVFFCTKSSGLTPCLAKGPSSASDGITRPEYLSKSNSDFSLGSAGGSTCCGAAHGMELLAVASASAVACASCNACATSMTNVRDPVLGMRPCRRGELGDAEEGRACDGFDGDKEGVERSRGGWAIPARKGFFWRLGLGRTGSDDLTPINACSFHRLVVVLTLDLSA